MSAQRQYCSNAVAIRWPCALPACAAMARRAGFSGFLPIAAADALSGPITWTRVPACSSFSICLVSVRPGIPWRTPRGDRMITPDERSARSALLELRIPPSMYCRPPMLTGGQIPGTAQLAATASANPTPESRSNILVSPVSASTATTARGLAGQSCRGCSRAAMTDCLACAFPASARSAS